jgi:hypothetical protein
MTRGRGSGRRRKKYKLKFGGKVLKKSNVFKNADTSFKLH